MDLAPKLHKRPRDKPRFSLKVHAELLEVLRNPGLTEDVAKYPLSRDPPVPGRAGAPGQQVRHRDAPEGSRRQAQSNDADSGEGRFNQPLQCVQHKGYDYAALDGINPRLDWTESMSFLTWRDAPEGSHRQAQ